MNLVLTYASRSRTTLVRWGRDGNGGAAMCNTCMHIMLFNGEGILTCSHCGRTGVYS